jgi:hypothetical protein
MQKKKNTIAAADDGLDNSDHKDWSRIWLVLLIVTSSFLAGIDKRFLTYGFGALMPIAYFLVIPVWSIVVHRKLGKAFFVRVLVGLFVSLIVMALGLGLLLQTCHFGANGLGLGFETYGAIEFYPYDNYFGAIITVIWTAVIGFTVYALTYEMPTHFTAKKNSNRA